MDKLAENKRETTGSGGLTPPAKGKTKTFLIGKEPKTNDLLRISGCWRGVCSSGKRTPAINPNQTARIAYAERRVKPLARLLRCATALRVTAPLGCGSRRLVWPEGNLPARPHGSNAPVWGVMLSNRTLSNEIQNHWLICIPPFPS